jgi:hypothetical protein
MIELDYRKPEPSGLALRLRFFVVGWSGFHLHFAILYPMLSWLRYANDAADTWLFVFSLVGFVLTLSIVLLLVVKTLFCIRFSTKSFSSFSGFLWLTWGALCWKQSDCVVAVINSSNCYRR